MIQRVTILLALIIALSISAWSAPIHVATDGDDARDKAAAASASTPVKTITRAIALASANEDTIFVAGGTYSSEYSHASDTQLQFITVNKAGLTFTATGAVTVTVGHADTKRVLRINNGANNTTITVSGSGSWTFDGLRGEGLYCDYGIEVLATATGTKIDHATVKRAVALINLADAQTTGNEIVSCTLTDSGEAITNCAAINSWHGNELLVKDCTFSLTGASTIRAIRIPNTSSGKTGAAVTIENCVLGTTGALLKCSNNVIGNDGSASVTIDGCTSVVAAGAGSWYGRTGATSTGSDTLTDNTITMVTSSTPAIYIQGGSGECSISGNTITISGTQTQDVIRVLDQPNTVISDNTVSDNGTTATIASIRITTSASDKSAANALIRNNAVYRPLATGGYTILVGADSYSANTTQTCDGAVIEYNRVYGLRQAADFSTHGPMLGYNRGAMRFNWISGCAYGCIAKSGTGTPQDWAGYEGIHHNVTVDARRNGLIVSGADNVRFESNTVYRSALVTPANAPIARVKQNEIVESGSVGDCDGTIFRYNILFGAAGARVFLIEADQTNTVFQDNCFYITGATESTDLFTLGAEGATLAEFIAAGYTDPGMFANPRFRQAGRDFRLLSSSPCINPSGAGKLLQRTDALYIPQYAWGALPPMHEPIKPVGR